MTPEDKKHLEDVERDRKKREEALILLLLLLMDEVSDEADRAFKAHQNPAQAAAMVILGSTRPYFPPFSATLAQRIADAEVAAENRVRRWAELKNPSIQLNRSIEMVRRYQDFATVAAQALADRVSLAINTEVIDAATEGRSPAFAKSLCNAGLSHDNQSALILTSENAILQGDNDGAYSAYNAQDVGKLLIAFKHISVLDHGTTDICTERANLMLPIDDVYWRLNWPKLHWRCRSTVFPIFNGEYYERSEILPDIPPAPGFGLAPIWVQEFSRA